METISFKLEDELLKEVDQKLALHRYGTRTEFIRDAIREKLSDLEKQEILKELVKLKGASKRKTTDAGLHQIREAAFAALEAKTK